jgi:hypothetical protein
MGIACGFVIEYSVVFVVEYSMGFGSVLELPAASTAALGLG